MSAQITQYVLYRRVSTQEQGKSGLGLEAQQMAVRAIAEGNKAVIQKFNKSASTSKFSLDEGSVLSITKLESANPERCLCSYVTKDLPAEALAKVPATKRGLMPHEGDIVPTYVNQSGQPVVIKTFRKVQS